MASTNQDTSRWWHDISNARWCRDLDESETFYATVELLYNKTGRIFFAITGHITVVYPISNAQDVIKLDAALESAWSLLRNEQVGLRTRTEFSNGRFQRVFDPSDSAREDYFYVVSDGQTGAEFTNSDPPVPRYPSLFVLRSEYNQNNAPSSTVRRDLVLRSRHDILDGKGTLLILNRLLELLRSEMNGQGGIVSSKWDVDSLPQPFSAALNLPASPPPHLYEKLKNLAEADREQLGGLDTLMLRHNRENKIPGKHQRVAVTMSMEQSSKVVSMAKSKNLTVTQIYHAAIAVVMRLLQPELKRPCYTTYGLIDLRNLMPKSTNQTAGIVGIYHTTSSRALVVDMSGSTDLWKTTINEVHRFYEDIREDTDACGLYPIKWKNACPEIPVNIPDTIPEPNTRPPVTLSSMGVIDKIIAVQYGDLQVYDPWVTGEELRNGYGLFLGAFRGQLSLSCAYNDVWHSRLEATDFVEQCHRIVLEGLGLLHTN